MPVEQRAKQFMPFAALKGFEDEIRKREQTAQERKTLSPDRIEEINWKLESIAEDSNVSILYFRSGEYIQQNGFVSFNDSERKMLKVADREIEYEDICDIEIL